jgi:aminopeptidase N
LNKYKYSNAIQDNLWEELTKQAHKDKTLDEELNIKNIMDTWTLQKGYPVVHLNIDYDNNDTILLNIKQNWFLLNPLSKKNNDYKWYIPFTYTTSKELNFNFETKPIWLKPNDTSVQLVLNDDSLDNQTWFIGNIKHSGFYRVNYDENNWNLLIHQLLFDHTQIDAINRAQLIDDSFNLGRAGLIDQTFFLRICSYLVDESDPLAFQTAFIGLNYIADMLSFDNETYQMFQVKGLI